MSFSLKLLESCEAGCCAACFSLHPTDHVSSDVESGGVRSVVHQLMERRRVGMERHNDIGLLRERIGENLRRCSVRVTLTQRQTHQVQNVDETDLDGRASLAQVLHSGESLHRQHVTAGSEDDIRLLKRKEHEQTGTK